MKRHTNNNGFTLIELLMVISIIGILSSVFLSSTNTVRAKARNTQRIQNVESIITGFFVAMTGTTNQFPRTPTVSAVCLGKTGPNCWGYLDNSPTIDAFLRTGMGGEESHLIRSGKTGILVKPTFTNMTLRVRVQLVG